MSKENIIYKPIQYLGAKTRTLDVIVSESKRLYEKNSYVIDLFSGSSVVSQSLYHNGMSVIANDVMKFCSDMSMCLLNVHRNDNSTSLVRDAVVRLHTYKLSSLFIDPFESLIAQEEQLLKARDLQGLKILYSKLSLVGSETVPPSEHVRFIRENIGKDAYNNVPLITNYYAGTYFGIRQSIRLDTIRSYIEYFYKNTGDVWGYTAMLTALYGVLSTVVHSAGKHFAQPIIITDLDKSKITNIRFFENRGCDIDNLFTTYLDSILLSTTKGISPSNCVSICSDILADSFMESLGGKSISVVYADPPYTSQQYSRFYHIPEVVRLYKYPQLQYYRGKITQGLYPEDKFKSDFCSKTKAKDAFKTMFNLVEKLQCNFILSYSESKKEKTGNERIVTKNEILSIASEILSNYKVKQLDFDFEYKQLNSSSKVVSNKEDKEFLITFEKK